MGLLPACKPPQLWYYATSRVAEIVSGRALVNSSVDSENRRAQVGFQRLRCLWHFSEYLLCSNGNFYISPSLAKSHLYTHPIPEFVWVSCSGLSSIGGFLMHLPAWIPRWEGHCRNFISVAVIRYHDKNHFRGEMGLFQLQTTTVGNQGRNLKRLVSSHTQPEQREMNVACACLFAFFCSWSSPLVRSGLRLGHGAADHGSGLPVFL